MKQLAKEIYKNARRQVFSKDALRDNHFDCLCYHQMIDDSHSIVIWGDEDNEGRYFTISIRTGATDDWAGSKELFCDSTPDASYKSLYNGIKEKITRFLMMQNKMIEGV